MLLLFNKIQNMKILKKEQTKNLLSLSLSVENRDLQNAFDKVFNKLKNGVNVKGFRSGKAPKNLILKEIGSNKIQEETFSETINNTYAKVSAEQKIDPIDYPKIDVKKFTLDINNPEKVTGELEYTIEIEVMPEPKMKDFSKIKLSKQENTEVSDKEVEDVIEYLRKQKASFKSIAKPAEKGNRVEINFEGEIEGKKLPELKSKNHPLILGENTMIPGFEDNLIKMKTGDKKDFFITFPSDYSKTEFSGKKVKFNVEMLLVQKVILQEKNDKMAKDFGRKNLTELKKAIKKNIEDEKIHNNRHKEEEEIVEQLLKLVEVEVPEILVNKELDHMVDDAKKRTEQYKISFDNYLAQIKKTENEFKESMREQAQKAVQIGFALKEVIKKLDIKGENNSVGAKAMDELFKIAYKNSNRDEYKPHHHHE